MALVIDYGAWAEGPTGDTLQATSQHAPCDPLDAPGTADLTTHVDFRALAEAASGGGAAVYGPVPQGTFLATLGVHLRTAKLLERAAPDQRRALRAALFRLTDPGAMGELFKVLVLAHPAAPAPPGFHAPTLLAMLTASNLGRLDHVRHGFFTREGGVSEGEFASLNCGYSSGDEIARVEANRARALQRLGMAPASLCTVRQVHGAVVVRARAPQPKRPSVQADALVTDRPHITLGVLSADCAPVLLADAEAGVIGAAHAGWRGALAGVIEATVEAMVGLGARPRPPGRRDRPVHRPALLRGRPGAADPVHRPRTRAAPICSRLLRAPTGCCSTSKATCCAASRAPASSSARRCRTTPTPTRRSSSAPDARARRAASASA